MNIRPVDRALELQSKAVEMNPLAKMTVMTGMENARAVTSTLQFLANQIQPHSLQAYGYDGSVTPMDRDLYEMIRDNHIYSGIRKMYSDGVTKQFGSVKLTDKNAPEVLIGAASDIASVEMNDEGKTIIHRKRELGVKNKHDQELVKEFHNPIDDRSAVEDDIRDVEHFADDQTEMIKLVREEQKPMLKNDDVERSLKKNNVGIPVDEGYDPVWE